MEFLSVIGKTIIVLSLLGFAFGFYLDYSFQASSLAYVLTFAGLVGGIYIGFLGVKVEALDEEDHNSGVRDQINKLSKRIERLENPSPTTNQVGGPREDAGRLRRDFLLNAGWSEKDIDNIGDLGSLTPAQFGDIARGKRPRQD